MCGSVPDMRMLAVLPVTPATWTKSAQTYMLWSAKMANAATAGTQLIGRITATLAAATIRPTTLAATALAL